MQVGSIQSGGASQALTSWSSAFYDPKDTNKDGTVSVSEELAYTLDHPLQQIFGSSRSAESLQITSAAHETRSSTPLGVGYFDPKDTNRDGRVSPSEANFYALIHPEKSLFEAYA